MTSTESPDTLTPAEMRRFQAHLDAAFWDLKTTIAGPAWPQVRARAHALGDARIGAVIDAYEAGRIARFHDLKIVTATLARLGDHPRYERAVQLFDPALSFSAGEKSFIGSGMGGGSLNVYRAITVNGARLFEKIYLQNAACFQHTAFVHETVLPRLREVKYPALRRTARGARLAAAYFDHVEARPRRFYSVEAAAAVVRALAALDISELDRPAFATRFDKTGFLEGREIILARLRARAPARAERMRLKLAQWQEIVAAYPRVFAHGDLGNNNLLADGHVIDWDAAGFFPYGHDPAYVAHHATLFSDLEDLAGFFTRNFARPGAPRSDYAGFLFFFVHFMQAGARQRRNTPLFDALLAALERELG